MIYAKALQRELNRAKPATGMTREAMQTAIDEISKVLIGPCRNSERIMLAADRESLHLGIAALDALDTAS